MKFKYIAIEREYGSGGTKVARTLAEECGIACYGQEILEAVAQKQNVTVERIQQYEETVSNSLLFTMFALSRAREGEADMLTGEGYLFVAEQQEIRQLAAKGPAVFLGHCAAEAIRDRSVLRVFIRCSDKQEKAKRIAEEYGIPEGSIASTQKRFDHKRARYYYANTGKRWENTENYDIILDSARLGIEGCAAVLKALIR